ncbi:MAG: radical SAM protein [Acidobacteriota bacterium]|nr:radical SAM protein [Acidobacteriota bacterium]
MSTMVMPDVLDLSQILKKPYVHPAEVTRELPGDALRGARVTLINMPIREQAKPNNGPLGPALLAARLMERGAEVTLVDLNAYRIHDHEAERRNLPNGRVLSMEEAESLLARTFARAGDQDLIGLSGLITTLRWQEAVAVMCRRLQPAALMASGGGLATEFREVLFRWIPELDAVAHSEGDDVILKMAYDAKLIRERGLNHAVSSGKLAPYLLDVLGGRPKLLYEGGRPRDLDAVPLPAWDLLRSDVDGVGILEMYLGNPIWGLEAQNSSATPFNMSRSINTVSSRGCPFACKFCFRGAQGERNYGVRSARNLADEIVFHVEKYGLDFVGISDDNFMVNPKRIADLAPIMKPVIQQTGVRWGTHGRLDEAADLRPGKQGSVFNNPRRVDLMREAGCVYIGFGAESASPRVLENMGKGGFILTNGTVTVNGYKVPRTMMEGVKATKQADIHGNCTWIMGYPGETLDDLKTSVAFIKWQEDLYTEGLQPGSPDYRINKASVNKRMFVATAYPGTEMFKHPRVRETLTRVFGIQWNPVNNHPVADEKFHNYVLELNDATKVLQDEYGQPFNCSDLTEDQFLQARQCIDEDRLFDILDL